MIVNKAMKKALKRAMADNDWTRKKLAEHLGVCVKTLWKILKSENEISVRLSTFEAISNLIAENY